MRQALLASEVQDNKLKRKAESNIEEHTSCVFGLPLQQQLHYNDLVQDDPEDELEKEGTRLLAAIMAEPGEGRRLCTNPNGCPQYFTYDPTYAPRRSKINHQVIVVHRNNACYSCVNHARAYWEEWNTAANINRLKQRKTQVESWHLLEQYIRQKDLKQEDVEQEEVKQECME